MNTIRTFTALFNQATEDDLLTFYKPGNIPAPTSSDRVAANLDYLNLVVNLPNLPVLNQYSGRTIEFYLKIGNSTAVSINRLDLRPGVVPYTLDLITFLWGDRNPSLSPDSELSAKLIDTGYGFLSPNETLAIYGSAIEEIEFNQDTLIQQLN